VVRVGPAPPDLFPAGVTLAVAEPGDDEVPLHPDEAALVARAVERRRRDFTAGRACAREALAALGFPVDALGAHPERDPVWPAGVVGSITHTDGWVAAAVAPAAAYAGLGLDAESATPLDDALVALVCRPGEPTDPLGAKAVFCAKEAVYKAVFPATRTFLEFHDVEVRFADGPPAGRDGTTAFTAVVRATGLQVDGRLERAGALVRAGAHLLR
jgi:4'-phosphopantetheinyl transferase EntD